ncbi:MAG: hypothetical protein CO113_04275 [Elusimicrobia bacterium CG_4_9_14_3_um_filter_62_55]|nr:MAG: hypothetical protein COR54_18000 [Elusimicrobia bacterium CG22_combo_CG10-13_8_21_14_all_63_91]PJA17554.1 MAG: hypothetical protein COX66_04090 [Elusimicrobia bacterium CG_4_10_14_0_2_um_filter_63_34]PJB26295.1 MAG: hypothetical protein CO113_04275 [Elusimicrobia bacterium CG_4_9_14_3_um_filter_62_55]
MSPAFLVLAAASLISSARAAGTHDMPVHPVHARLWVDPGLIRVRIVTDGAILANERLGLDLPVSGWPEDKLRDAKAWIDEEFSLAADGRPLEGRLIDASYRIDAWKKIADVGTVGWDGMFLFDLAYDLPEGAETLSGRASFYAEEWEALEKILESGVKPMFEKNFMTYVAIPGRERISLEITITSPSFSVPLDAATRTGTQRLLEAAAHGIALPWPVLYGLLALVLILSAAPPAAPFAAVVCASLVFSLGAGVAEPFARAAPWAGLCAAAAFSLKRAVPRSAWLGVVGVLGGVGFGLGWGAAAQTLARIPMGTAQAKAGFLLGSLAAAVPAAAAAGGLYAGYRLYLKRESEQMAARLLAQNGRFASAAVAALGAVYALRSLLGR